MKIALETSLFSDLSYFATTIKVDNEEKDENNR